MLPNNIIEEDMKDIRKTEWDMVLEHSIIKREENILVNGLRIKCKVGVLYITPVEISHMKGNGWKTSFMDMVCSTIKTLNTMGKVSHGKISIK